jgi:hypothetical protein
LRRAIDVVRETTAPVSLELSRFSSLYIAALSHMEDQLNAFASNVNFIGPLRMEPARFYELAGHHPGNVGPRGEYTAQLLFKHRDTELMPELRKWLTEFGFDHGIRIHPLHDDIFALYLEKRHPGSSVNLADGGFGISQVLPILVQGLDGNPGSVLVTEQPEIHLNPRLQTMLARFFAYLVSRRQRVLVETHSEHLLLSLRRLVAERAIRASDIAVYYVEKSGNASRLRNVPVQDDGHVSSNDWPAGFFEDSLHESLALAVAQSRDY